jgi:hypothetical protein
MYVRCARTVFEGRKKLAASKCARWKPDTKSVQNQQPLAHKKFTRAENSPERDGAGEEIEHSLSAGGKKSFNKLCLHVCFF